LLSKNYDGGVAPLPSLLNECLIGPARYEKM